MLWMFTHFAGFGLGRSEYVFLINCVQQIRKNIFTHIAGTDLWRSECIFFNLFSQFILYKYFFKNESKLATKTLLLEVFHSTSVVVHLN